jgi:hypothetical protein
MEAKHRRFLDYLLDRGSFEAARLFIEELTVAPAHTENKTSELTETDFDDLFPHYMDWQRHCRFAYGSSPGS